MKIKEKEAARNLRKEGKSINEIVSLLKVSKASVSVWVRDIHLTKEQENALLLRCNSNPGRFNGGRKNREVFLEQRKRYQEEGRLLARNKRNDWLFVSGCMLYWAEGSKARNSVGLINTDPNLLKVFLKFLCGNFDVKIEDIKLGLQYHAEDNINNNYYEDFWIKELQLRKENIKKSVIDHRSRTSIHNGKGRRNKYGCCRILVHKTDVVQKIYGAIQELVGFSNEEWLG